MTSTPIGFATLLLLAAPIEAPAQDLSATATPPGFAGPIVPRNAADATSSSAPATPLSTTTNYLNWGIAQVGPPPFPAWQSQVLLDGVLLSTKSVPSNQAEGWHTWVNVGPFAIRGGWHTLSVIADATGAVAESDETNNLYQQQFAWPPPALAANTAVVRPAPPDPGAFPHPNADTFEATGLNSFPWVVSVAPLDATDDYDLETYEGSSLTAVNGASSQRGPGTDLVEFPQSISVPPVYPAVVRYATGAAAGCLLDLATASGNVHSQPGDVTVTGRTLPANRLAHIHQFIQFPATTNYVTLTTPFGADDLAFAIFPSPTVNGHTNGLSLPSALVRSAEMTAAIDTARCGTPSTLNLVVYRTDAGRIGEAVPYTIEWNTAQYVGVEDAPSGRISLNALPNPARGAVRLRLALPAAGLARVVLHDVRGREVARLHDGTLPAGVSMVPWDLRDAGGRRVRPGLYYATAEAGGRKATARVIVLDELR